MSDAKQTILLVEDDCPVRMILRRMLEGYGYRILEATTARQALEVELGGGGHRLDHILQRIAVDARQQIEQEDRDLRIGQKLRHEVALPQVFGHAKVVCKVAVMHQRLIHAYKGMCAGRVPYPSLGRVTLMGNPDIRLEIIQLVILDNLLSISHNL